VTKIHWDRTSNPSRPSSGSVETVRILNPGIIPCALKDKAGPWQQVGKRPPGELTYAFGKPPKRTFSKLPKRSVGVNPAKNAVRAAFKTWSDSGSGVKFSLAKNPKKADILVEWRPAADLDCRPGGMVGDVIAHADYPYPHSKHTQKGKPLPLHFDDDEHMWAVDAVPGAYDIETVALHEIGHCLGLTHSEEPDAVMNPTFRVNFLRRKLDAGAVKAIKALYP
jgi:hypothetical protein